MFNFEKECEQWVASDRIKELESRNGELARCVEFYANPDSWVDYCKNGEYITIEGDFYALPHTDKIGGKLAIETLNKIQ